MQSVNPIASQKFLKMPENRFFSDTPLNELKSITLTDVELHHLAHVMRCKVGDSVELVNGKGVLARALVLSISKREANLEIISIVRQEKLNSCPIILIQALPRPNRLDTILEKGTEIGMDEIWLFPGEKSERGLLNEHQLHRMQGVIISSMKQCGRLFSPKITLKPPIKKWDSSFLPHPAYFGDLSENAPPFSSCKKGANGCCFIIGPESGFSEEEKKMLTHLKAEGVLLNPNILRTDTAALVALSLMSSWRGPNGSFQEEK